MLFLIIILQAFIINLFRSYRNKLINEKFAIFLKDFWLKMTLLFNNYLKINFATVVKLAIITVVKLAYTFMLHKYIELK